MDRTTITIKQESLDLIKTIKSCFQIGRHRDITIDEILQELLVQGLKANDSKVWKIFELSTIEEENTDSIEGMEEGKKLVESREYDEDAETVSEQSTEPVEEKADIQ